MAVCACTAKEGTAPSSADTSKATTADTACSEVPNLGWLSGVAKDPKVLEGAGGGWVALYQRDYRGAAEKFASASSEPLATYGEARAHLRLGQLYLRLARVVARSQAAYFEARDALGAEATPLKKGAYFLGLSQLVGGQVEAGQQTLAKVLNGQMKAPGAYKVMARAVPKACTAKLKASNAWNQVANLIVCQDDLPACPAKVGAAPAQDPWKTRVALYHAALCADPDTVDEQRLTQMASSPADTEELKGKGSVKATLDYYDPAALWALGQVHLRKTEALASDKTPAARLLRAWAAALRGNKAGATEAMQGLDAAALKGVDSSFLMLSDHRDASALAEEVRARLAGSAAKQADLTLAQMRKQEAADVAGAQCGASADGKKVVQELGLAPGFARAALRRASMPLLNDQKTCEGALRALRATQDIKNLESVSYVNEPAFLVGLAEAALCMRRSAEAIGTLRTVKDAYPEAEAALAAASGLSVVRLMGGTGGTQKIQ